MESENKNKQEESDKKSRRQKLYKKVGAGFLAALSLVGLGSAVSGKASKSPKPLKGVSGSKAKRQVETVQQEQDSQVEEDIQQEMQKLTLQQQEAQEQQSSVSTVTLLGAYATWVGVMGVFVSSLFFNKPFPLGFGLMALLPGEPHTVELELVSDVEEVKVDDSFEIDLMVNSGFAVLGEIKADMEFDPEVIQIEKIIYDDTFFPVTEKNFFDNESGKIVLIRSFGDEDEKKKAEDERVATLRVKAKASLGEGEVELAARAKHPGIDSDGCYVYGKSGNSNLIASVSDIFFNLEPRSNERKIKEVIDVTENIEVDGDLSEWDPAILDYVGFSKNEKGNLITYLDIVKGENKNELDIAFNFSVARKGNVIYIAAHISDDSLIREDEVEIIINGSGEVFSLTGEENFPNRSYVVEEIEEGSYLFEAKIEVLDGNVIEEDFNVTVFDHDDDGSSSVNKFSY